MALPQPSVIAAVRATLRGFWNGRRPAPVAEPHLRWIKAFGFGGTRCGRTLHHHVLAHNRM
jgi:hypothetical protein